MCSNTKVNCTKETYKNEKKYYMLLFLFILQKLFCITKPYAFFFLNLCKFIYASEEKYIPPSFCFYNLNSTFIEQYCWTIKKKTEM